MSELALSLQNVTKKYPSGFTLDHVSFDLPGGCIMGFIGENGAGKSTTIKLILDLINRDSGSITLLGRSNVNFPKKKKEEIGVVLDESCLPDTCSVKMVGSIMRSIYSSWNQNKYNELIRKFDLPEKKLIKDYSRGMKTKLSIAVALAHNPKLLILDEATSGLDPVVRDEILDIFLDFIQEEDHTILISSHILSDLEKICDYITFIHKGKVLFCKPKDELLEEYGVLKCSEKDLASIDPSIIKGVRKNQFGVEALVLRKELRGSHVVDRANIEDIMLYHVKEER
ncbi:ABC transporter ATP-binding protein [Anaerolentibacter hominis]|uniref:ABC transporter ATP-binding protein n=1 Tax=Anaerolentibacter hominis TaxID=3079009 RepID=UPI0031B7F848